LLCLFQCNLPLLSGVALCLCLGLRKDSVSNLEVTMRWAVVACCVPSTRGLRRGFADWAQESSHESLIWFIHPQQHNHVVANRRPIPSPAILNDGGGASRPLVAARRHRSFKPAGEGEHSANEWSRKWSPTLRHCAGRSGISADEKVVFVGPNNISVAMLDQNETWKSKFQDR